MATAYVKTDSSYDRSLEIIRLFILVHWEAEVKPIWHCGVQPLALPAFLWNFHRIAMVLPTEKQKI